MTVSEGLGAETFAAAREKRLSYSPSFVIENRRCGFRANSAKRVNPLASVRTFVKIHAQTVRAIAQHTLARICVRSLQLLRFAPAA